MPDGLLLITKEALAKAWPLIIFYAFVLGFFYFFLIRPQSKRHKDHRDFVDSLKKGDRIVTAGGIHGSIVQTKGEVIHVDVGKGILVRFDRSAVRRRQGDDEK